ncbi:ubiquitin-conjugating enzyme E2 S [Gryganskiella cystojenkinii]|nr:ubiquitin-conjugating enzyme E2 S [Gryganskiella cystojenkinii]
MDFLSTTAIRKVSRELYILENDPPEGIRLIPSEESIADIQAWIKGPGFFTTKIFHPNVSLQGDVCVSTLKKDWKRDLGLRHILLVVKCLLIVPNAESALNEEAGRQLLERFDDYAKHARLMTSIHARSNTNIIFPSVTAPAGSPTTPATQWELQEASTEVATATDTPEIISQGVKRKLTVEFEESKNQNQIKSQQFDFKGSLLKGNNAAGSGATGQTTLFLSPSSIQQQQLHHLSFGNSLSQVTTGAGVLSSVNGNVAARNAHMTGVSSISDNLSQTIIVGIGAGSIGESGKDRVGIITAVDRKRALRRL